MEDFSKYLPTHCPSCNSLLSFDGIHLTCPNENCVGRIAKKLASASTALDIKGIGGKTLEPFAKDFKNMYELIRNILQLTKSNATFSLEKYGIADDSRSFEIFVNAFKNIRSLTYEQVIVMLGYDNVGRKLSIQIAREHAGLQADYSGLEKALVAMLHEPQVEAYIKSAVSTLEALGITIDKPKDAAVNTNSVFVCMTGSPKVFGFATKGDFMTKFPSLIEVDLSDKKCQYLITDSYQSTSSKMKVAEKKNITIKTYGDFKL